MTGRLLQLVGVVSLVLVLATCEGDRGPTGPQGPAGADAPTLGHIEDTRVVFPRSELTVTSPSGVLLNLVATNGPVGIRFYKDFGFGNEQQTNPWHMGFIEGVKGYQGLAILRDWLFTSALWDAEGRLLVGRLDPHPPANPPANARFHVRGTVNEIQAIVEVPSAQTAPILQIVRGGGAQGTATTHFAVDGQGNTRIGSPSQPKAIMLFDTVDGAAYSLTITNGQLSITKVP
jgi:hypothetical protein